MTTTTIKWTRPSESLPDDETNVLLGLRTLLTYDPDTGIFRWAVNKSRARAGNQAGSKNKSTGYVQIRVNQVRWAAHRLAWLFVHERLPMHQIDHINGDRADNRICNLRDVPGAVNRQNQTRPHKCNRGTGVLGVRYLKDKDRYVARVQLNGRRYHSKELRTIEQAREAYVTMKRALHPGCTL